MQQFERACSSIVVVVGVCQAASDWARIDPNRADSDQIRSFCPRTDAATPESDVDESSDRVS